MSEGGKPVLVAFSGGLDTSWCVARERRLGGRPVVTATVDTGGFDAAEIADIEARSAQLGAERHVLIDGRQAVFDRFVRFLVAGNCLRGAAYPLCVAAERIVQAEEIAKLAAEIGVDQVVHGSTGAGNDQIRFDVAFAVVVPDVAVSAPVRELAPSRDEEYAFLEECGMTLPREQKTYSINRGLWGTTIGGGDLHRPERPVPTDCWPDTVSPDAAPAEGEAVAVTFTEGVPTAVDGTELGGPDLVAELNRRAAAHGIGRGIHTGDTILGIKGRLAFEAPAAAVLLFAHRELEKLVLTKHQQTWKDQLGAFYASAVHEALYFDPVARDVEAFLASTQQHVTGTVHVHMTRGRLEVAGVDTDRSLMGRLGAVYGEGSGGWTGEEARGFAKIYGLPSVLAARRDRDVSGGGDGNA
jgi:argininosuccinate synthase